MSAEAIVGAARPRTGASMTSTPPTPPKAHAMKTLVVEDDPFIRQLLEEILRDRGHDPTVCEDAESAWEAYQAEPYPLVLLDWLLDGMDGLELCRRMRASPQGERSAIVMVTVKDGPQDLKACLEAGADDYLKKPIDIELLSVRLSIAERAVEQRQKRSEAEARVAEVVEELRRSRDDVLAILDELRIGSVIANEAGGVAFVSKTAQAILGRRSDDVHGSPWDEALPLEADAVSEIRAMAARDGRDRSKVTVRYDAPGRRGASLEVEIRDDPRDARRKIFLLYDVTEVQELRRALDERSSFQDMVGRSQPIRQVFEQIQQVASVDSTVLIEGDTGTGKELVARAIHDCSHRSDGPFIPVNCAGLTESVLASQLFGHKRGAFTGAVADHEGLFEAASGGTLFLDEIGDIPPSVQTSLLRFLQEREITRLGESKPRKVNVRVLCATHRDLAVEAEKGSFRQDLLYRIRVARIQLPALAQRREDIPLLAGAFLGQLAAETGKDVREVSHGAMRLLMDYGWPGNVRELRSAIECAVIRCRGREIQVDDLPPEVAQPAARPSPRFALPRSGPPDPEAERSRILAALESAGGNRSRAAKLLGMSRATFYRRLDNLDIVLDG